MSSCLWAIWGVKLHKKIYNPLLARWASWSGTHCSLHRLDEEIRPALSFQVKFISHARGITEGRIQIGLVHIFRTIGSGCCGKICYSVQHVPRNHHRGVAYSMEFFHSRETPLCRTQPKYRMLFAPGCWIHGYESSCLLIAGKSKRLALLKSGGSGSQCSSLRRGWCCCSGPMCFCITPLA